MCKFFSLVSNGKGTIYYFDWKMRKKILKKELIIGNHAIDDVDSHSSIIDWLQDKRKYIGNDFDKKFNKYEYNPLTKHFEVDQISVKDDSEIVKRKCLELDFSKIVAPLVIKEIINPITDRKIKKVTKDDIELLKKWASVNDSAWAFVSASVWASVSDFVWASVSDFVWASVSDFVRDFVRDSVRDFVRNSVWASVRDSVRDSVWAYISSFFILDNWKNIDHEKGKNPFQSAIDLWEKGIVPSFDGTTWRLHGYKGRVIYEHKEKKI